MKYLVVKCDELADQWECDADRTPIYVGDNIKKYNRRGYEIYEIRADGSLERIRKYDEDTREGWCICWRKDDKEDTDPYKVIEFEKPSKADIKKIKKFYGFEESVEDIILNLDHCKEHGEMINNEWVVIGEFYDNHYPTGG